MNIKLFLEISKEFFDLMHSPFIDYEYKENINEIVDEETGFIAYNRIYKNENKYT